MHPAVRRLLVGITGSLTIESVRNDVELYDPAGSIGRDGSSSWKIDKAGATVDLHDGDRYVFFATPQTDLANDDVIEADLRRVIDARASTSYVANAVLALLMAASVDVLDALRREYESSAVHPSGHTLLPVALHRHWRLFRPHQVETTFTLGSTRLRCLFVRSAASGNDRNRWTMRIVTLSGRTVWDPEWDVLDLAALGVPFYARAVGAQAGVRPLIHQAIARTIIERTAEVLHRLTRTFNLHGWESAINGRS